MRNSDIEETAKKGFFHKTGVKVISSVVLFIVFAGLITAAVSYPFERIYSTDNEFEVLILGASRPQAGISPEVLTRRTGEKTYLLSTVACSMEGRYEMLKAAIKQDSLKLVLLDISEGVLTGATDEIFNIDMKALYFTRIDGALNKLKTMFAKFSLWDDEYDQLYAAVLNDGITAWQAITDGSYNYLYGRHGFKCNHNNFSASTAYLNDYNASYNMQELDMEVLDNKVSDLIDIIQLCREHNVQIALVTCPMSELGLWITRNYDEFYAYMVRLCESLGISYYDFNLLKNRQDYLTDTLHYSDIEHLDAVGSGVFSNMLSELINSILAGEPCPFEFYRSYGEAKSHSSYQAYRTK